MVYAYSAWAPRCLFNLIGNAKASKCGTSNSKVRVFLYICPTLSADTQHRQKHIRRHKPNVFLFMPNIPRKPLVAIKCLVFNHEPYLRDCLEGFVMQQTDFPFVAIVHDDASTDHSADIIREYAAKYPDIILPIYETENQYSKHDGSLGRIMNTAVDATGAKYVAMCEGDDYWTDPH